MLQDSASDDVTTTKPLDKASPSSRSSCPKGGADTYIMLITDILFRKKVIILAGIRLFVIKTGACSIPVVSRTDTLF